MATVTSKGQITIPKRVRDALGIRAGTELEFQVEGESVRMRKADNRAAIDRWRGALDLGEPVDDFVDRLRGDR
jgi:antitoxin PrlF